MPESCAINVVPQIKVQIIKQAKDIALFIQYLSNNTSSSLVNMKNISIELFIIAFLSGILRIYLTWYLPHVSSFIATKLGRKIAYDLTKVETVALEAYTKEELTDTLTTQVTLSSLAIRQGLLIVYFSLSQAAIMITAFYLAPEIMITSISIIFIFYILFYRFISSEVNRLSITLSNANISLLSQTLSLTPPLLNTLILTLTPTRTRRLQPWKRREGTRKKRLRFFPILKGRGGFLTGEYYRIQFTI